METKIIQQSLNRQEAIEEAYIKKYYNGDISKLNVYKGSIAPIKEWNFLNCGIQYEFSLPINFLLRLGLLRGEKHDKTRI